MLKRAINLFLLFLSTPLIAQSSPLPQRIENKQYFIVCNSNAGNSDSCSHYTNDRLLKITSLYIFNPDVHCDNAPAGAPDDKLCNQSSVGVNATFLIVDAQTGNATKTLIKATQNSGYVSYSTIPQSLTYEEKELAESTQVAEYEYKVLANNFKLTQHLNRQVYNANGTLVDSVNTDTEGNFGNCHTATSYLYFDQLDDSMTSCTSFINGMIDQIAADSNSNQNAGVSFTDWLRSWNADAANLGQLSFKISNYKKFTYVLSFDDGSKLAINIDIDDKRNALITLNEYLSRTSEKLTFKQYAQSLKLAASTTHNRDEVLSFLGYIGAKDSCYTKLVNLGYRQRLRTVVTERFPDGRPKTVEIILLSQTPVNESTIVCSSSPLGN